jgi:hypothetical protein
MKKKRKKPEERRMKERKRGKTMTGSKMRSGQTG